MPPCGGVTMLVISVPRAVQKKNGGLSANKTFFSSSWGKTNWNNVAPIKTIFWCSLLVSPENTYNREFLKTASWKKVLAAPPPGGWVGSGLRNFLLWKHPFHRSDKLRYGSPLSLTLTQLVHDTPLCRRIFKTKQNNNHDFPCFRLHLKKENCLFLGPV